MSLVWRKGTCASLRLRLLTVCSRKLSERLMYCASFSACPVTPLFLVRSLPAKSTKLSLQYVTCNTIQ